MSVIVKLGEAAVNGNDPRFPGLLRLNFDVDAAVGPGNNLQGKTGRRVTHTGSGSEDHGWICHSNNTTSQISEYHDQ